MLANIDDALKIITCMQAKRRYDETMVLHVFSWASNQKDSSYSEILEELKNRLSDERKDFYDIIDMLNALKINNRLQLYEIFYKNVIPATSKYKIKVISDVDNTAIENSAIAPIKYIDGAMVPGYSALLHMLSRDETTTTFISARPAFMEKLSITKLSQQLDSSLKYSFMSGSLIPLLELVGSKMSMGYFDSQTAYNKMAQLKFNRFRELFLVYPTCTFIFFGDDTQGDWRFAKYLVEHVSNSVAFIRKCKGTEFIDVDRIFLHNSYYEVMYKLIEQGYIDKTQISYILNDKEFHYDAEKYDSFQVAYDTQCVNMMSKLI